MIRSLQYFQLQISRIIRVIIEELFNRCTCFIGPVTLEGADIHPPGKNMSPVVFISSSNSRDGSIYFSDLSETIG